MNLMASASEQNIFKIPTHSRVMAGRKGRGVKFHDNKKCYKIRFLHVFLIYLVDMVISIKHIICRVLTNHNN